MSQIPSPRTAPDENALRNLLAQDKASFIKFFEGRFFTIPNKKDPFMAAACCRALDGDLTRIGMAIDPPLKGKSRGATYGAEHKVRQLVMCISHSLVTPDDALTIFDAAARLYRGHEKARGMELVTRAFDYPQWRDKAIAMHPELFKLAREGRSPTCNALDMFATHSSRSLPGAETYESARNTLELLKDLGWRTQGVTSGAMQLAAMYDCPQVMRAFMECFPDRLNMQDSSHNSLLHLAINKDAYNNVRELLAAGANPNFRNNTGDMPLSQAVFLDKIRCVQVLLSHVDYRKEDVAECVRLAQSQHTKDILLAHIARLSIDAAAASNQHLKPL